MYPSSLRMRAISSFSLEAGTSTFWCRALTALRMRVSMSATGSVNLIALLLLRRPFASAVAALAEEPAAALLARCSFGAGERARTARTPALPGRFRNPGNFSPQRQTAETQAAKTELAQIGARSAADLAAVVLAGGKFWFLRVLDSFCCCGHFAPS